MTLTPEMVEIERAAFEDYALREDLDTLRYHGMVEYHWLSTQRSWSAWLARAQSQRAVGVEDLRAIADEWDKTSVRNYGQKSSHAGELRALINRAGGEK